MASLRKGPADAALTQRDEAERPKTAPALAPKPVPKPIEPEDVTEEYIRTATPGQGEITYDDGYEIGKHSGEIKTAQWLHDTFGGDIRLLKEAKEDGVKMPDSIWREKMWEYKTARSVGAADKRLQEGLKQIREKPGGIVLNMTETVPMDRLEKQMLARFIRNTAVDDYDLMLLEKDDLVKVLRYKK